MQLLTLPEIFNNSIFRIPDYQRGYSWGKKQLEELWQDIINIQNAKDVKKTHYVGLITVQKHDEIYQTEQIKNLQAKAYHVVDGQQRLTSLLVLLMVINEEAQGLEKELENTKLSEDKKVFIGEGAKELIEKKYLFKKIAGNIISYFFGYSIDDPSNECLKTEIFGNFSAKSKNEKDTVYTTNLKDCKDFFKSKIQNEISKGKKEEKLRKLEQIFETLTQKLGFGYLCIDETQNIDIHVTFETMNNRGKFLSTLELLKNRLIYLSTLLDTKKDVENQLRNDINNAWKTIYTYLGKGNEKLDDDEFLQNHYIIFFKGETKILLYKEFLLEKYFTSSKIFDGTLTQKEITEYVKSIQDCVEYWFYMNYPNLITKELTESIKAGLILLKRLNNNNFKPLLLSSLTKKHKDSSFDELLSQMEKYIFCMYNISRAKSNTRQKKLYSLAQIMYYDNYHIKTFTKYLFEDYDLDTNKLIKYLNESFKNKKKGWYAWDGIQYFLYEYEEYLCIKNREKSKLSWENTTTDSIEHIFPQNAKEFTWKSIQMESEENQMKICNSLGNLLLISKGKNASLGNKSFEEKKKDYIMGYYTQNAIAKKNNWTPNEVYQRGKEMIEFMCERWNIQMLSESEIKRLLFFDKIKLKINNSLFGG